MDDTPERALAALEKYGGWYGVLRALEDAERYRWLRKHVTDAHAIYRDVNGHLQSFDFDCEGDVDFDAAINAAMNGANARHKARRHEGQAQG